MYFEAEFRVVLATEPPSVVNLSLYFFRFEFLLSGPPVLHVATAIKTATK